MFSKLFSQGFNPGSSETDKGQNENFSRFSNVHAEYKISNTSADQGTLYNT